MFCFPPPGRSRRFTISSEVIISDNSGRRSQMWTQEVVCQTAASEDTSVMSVQGNL